jgi:hypothetical protein
MNRIAIALVAVTATAGAAPAWAGPCAAEIAGIKQTLSRRERRQPDGFGAAPQSIAAQLEHQPTPASVARARKSARAAILDEVAKAESSDARGEQSACRDHIGRARLMLDP